MRYTLAGWIKIFTFYDSHEVSRTDLMGMLQVSRYAWRDALLQAFAHDFRFKTRTYLNPKIENVDFKILLEELKNETYEKPLHETKEAVLGPDDVKFA